MAEREQALEIGKILKRNLFKRNYFEGETTESLKKT